jgi:hypothetical protein
VLSVVREDINVMSAAIDVVDRLHALPDELVSKIKWYVLKSPHVDLEVGYLKKMVGEFIFDKFVEGEGLVVENGHVTELCLWGREYSSGTRPSRGYGSGRGGRRTFNNDDLSKIRFDLQQLEVFPELNSICLYNTKITGDIKHLGSLRKLSYLALSETDVWGDIEHLRGLSELEGVRLFRTGITGNIQCLCSLPKIKCVALGNTSVYGNTEILKAVPSLKKYDLYNTNVTYGTTRQHLQRFGRANDWME